MRLSNNLYKMQGTVVIEKEMAQASNSKHLWYKIWHARMGHMSDQGLEELASQGSLYLLGWYLLERGGKKKVG